jgi:hypothetical protein
MIPGWGDRVDSRSREVSGSFNNYIGWKIDLIVHHQAEFFTSSNSLYTI